MNRVVNMPSGIRLLFVLWASGVKLSEAACSDHVSEIEESYWEEIGRCSPCLAEGCGYCLSTLTCLSGTASGGPSDGSPCPNWIHSDKAGANACPGECFRSNVPPCLYFLSVDFGSEQQIIELLSSTSRHLVTFPGIGCPFIKSC